MGETFVNEALEAEERKVKWRYALLTAVAMEFALGMFLSPINPFMSGLSGQWIFSFDFWIKFVVLGSIGLLLGIWASHNIILQARKNIIFGSLFGLVGIGFLGGGIANLILYFDVSRMSYGGGEASAIAIIGAPVAGIIGAVFAFLAGSVALTITDALHYKPLRAGGFQLDVGGSNELVLSKREFESTTLTEEEERIKKRYMFLTAVALAGPTFFMDVLYYLQSSSLSSRYFIPQISLFFAAVLLFVLGLFLGSYVGKTIIRNAREGHIYGSLGKLVLVGIFGGGFATSLMYLALKLDDLSVEGLFFAALSAPFGAVVGGIFALISGLVALSITRALHYSHA